MKNLFKSFAVCVAFLVAAPVSAGTLYWQVQDQDTEFDEAWLVYENPDGTGKGDIEGVASQLPEKTSTALTQTDLSMFENSGYLFYVELVNYSTGSEENNWVVATGNKNGYQDLVSSGYIATGLNDANAVKSFASAQNFMSAPEPSSGLLLLMGGAILALRRRRQK